MNVNDKKTEAILVRVTREEYRIISSRAKRLGQTRAGFLRWLGLSERPSPRRLP